jgi:two-component system chemotaxis response regulator CheY
MSIMRKQILVVDDDLSILKLLNFILSKDYDLVIKQNGADAISWLEDGNDPALIISDLEMPYIDGGEFIRNLKISGFYRDTPVILLSGADNLDNIVSKMPFQADCYFKKPFNPAELKSSISEALLYSDVRNNEAG